MESKVTMNTDDVAYYYKRAEAELEAAQRADHPAVVKAHYLLASHYLDTLHERPADNDSLGLA